MTAIITKYLRATKRSPERIKAIAPDSRGDHTITIKYPRDVSDTESAHRLAALALALKMGWLKEEGSGVLIAGSLRENYVFVFANR